MKKYLTYQDTSFIVNAMNYYLTDFKSKTNLSKESMDYYQSIIDTFEKLENDILNLSIKEA